MGGLTWLGHDAVGGHLASLAWGDGHYHVILEHPDEAPSPDGYVLPRIVNRDIGASGHVLHPFAADHFLRSGDKRPSSVEIVVASAIGSDSWTSGTLARRAAIAVLPTDPTPAFAGLRSTILLI